MPQHHLPRTTPEQRFPLYQDVEDLLDYGFLTQTVKLNNTVLSLRSLCPGDQFLLRQRAQYTTMTEWQVLVVATTLWMIDDYYLLGERHALPRITKVVRRLPANIRQILFNVSLGLFNRTGKATAAVEPYTYETLSRYKWKSFGGHLSHEHAGIPGIQTLGTNAIQRMWAFYNNVEDIHVADDSMWEGFKLVASAMSPKGVKKISEHDKQTREAEKARRQAVQDRFYYLTRGIIKEEQIRKEMARGTHASADDLVDEMHRWVTGQEDDHDKVVRKYKETIAKRYQEHKHVQAKRIAEMQQLHEEESGQSIPLVGYTAAQLHEMLKDRLPGGVQEIGSGINQVREHLYEKYIQRRPDAGRIVPSSNGRLGVDNTPLMDRVAERHIVAEEY